MLVADELDEGLILRAHCVPIHAVHFGVVEAVLHRAPGIAEHFRPLGRLVDLDLCVEGNATPRASAERRGSRRRSLRAAGREGVRIDAAAFHVEDTAAIARNGESARTATKPAATSASTASAAALVRTLQAGDAGEALSVVLD